MKNFTTIKRQINEKEISIHILKDDKTIWLSQKSLSVIFGCSISSIHKCLSSILQEAPLTSPTISELEKVQVENGREVNRKIKLYHQEIIEELGRRKRSNNFKIVKEFVSNYLSKNNELLLKNNDIIIYDNGSAKVSLNISFEEQTVWATQKEIADVFLTSVPDISYHIKKIIDEGELDTDSVIKCHLNTGPDGKRYKVTFYNLDMVLAVGFRVSTKKATKFRSWATKVLSEYMIKGYAINESRCLECKDAIIGLQNRVLQLENNQNKVITFIPGDELRSFAAIERFLRSAEKEIIIVDNYFGHDFDSVLKEINVEKTIITNPKNTKIESDENYRVIKVNEFHDRYIIVDDACYFLGQSLGQLGSKISQSARIQDKVVIDAIKLFKEKLCS